MGDKFRLVNDFMNFWDGLKLEIRNLKGQMILTLSDITSSQAENYSRSFKPDN